MQRTLTCVLLLGTACHFDPVGESTPTSSESSSGDDPSATSTFSTTTSATSTSSDPTTTTTDPSSESSSDDASSNTSTSEESTGEPIVDWALRFDGTSHARKIGDGGVVAWTAADYTVEAWVAIGTTDAIGVIFDATDPQFTSGWVLYLHNDWHALVFSFFDDLHQNNVVMGPSVEEIGVGWHHIAATKSGNSVYLHIDGTAEVVETVPELVAEGDQTLWSLGGNASDNPDFRLRDAIVDDVRITAFARYADNFDPPASYDDDVESVLLLLRMDESEGVLLDDEAAQLDFSIEDPAWVPGNTEM